MIPSKEETCCKFAIVNSDRGSRAACAVCDCTRATHKVQETRTLTATQAFHERRSILKAHSPSGKVPEFTPDAALRAAGDIIARLSNDDEIDWSENPQSDRERELRAAVLMRAEAEGIRKAHSWHTDFGFELPSPVDIAVAVLNRLDVLEATVEDDETLGCDLYDALEKWRTKFDAAYREEKRLKARKLMSDARTNIGGKTDNG